MSVILALMLAGYYPVIQGPNIRPRVISNAQMLPPSEIFKCCDGETAGDLADDYGAAKTDSTTGPTYCFSDSGTILDFNDDVMRQACAVAPNLTGAGTPTSCPFFKGPSYTNSILQSRQLNTNWNANGTSVVSTASASAFDDSRQCYTVTDDNAGAFEWIELTTAKGAATQVTVVIDAWCDTGTCEINPVWEERNGGGCGNPLTDPGHESLTTTVQRFCYNHVFTDSNCTHFDTNLIPGDYSGGASETGNFNALVMVILDQSWCPPSSYVETAGTAVTAGGDLLSFATGNIVNGAGKFNKRVYTYITWAPLRNEATSASVLFQYDDGTENQKMLVNIDTSERLNWITTPGGTDITSAVQTLTPGTYISLIEADTKYVDVDAFDLQKADVSLGTSATARTSPKGVTTLRIGHDSASGSIFPGEACVSLVKVEEQQ